MTDFLDDLEGMVKGDTTDPSLRPNFDAAKPTPDRQRYGRVIFETDDIATDIAILVKETPPGSYNATTTYVNSDGSVTRLVAHDDGRSKITITNSHATDGVLIGQMSNVSAGDGYLLPAGKSITIYVRDDIWAVIVPGGTNIVPVAMWIERD